jgi:hypothetical protein
VAFAPARVLRVYLRDSGGHCAQRVHGQVVVSRWLATLWPRQDAGLRRQQTVGRPGTHAVAREHDLRGIAQQAEHRRKTARAIAAIPQVRGESTVAQRGPWSDDAYAIKYHIAYCLTYLALFVLLILTRLLTRAVYPQNIVAREMSPILFGLLLPLSFRSGGYIYDFPELVFLFATLLLMWQRRYWPCLLLMPLAALNKESILLWPAICAPVLWFQSAALGHDEQAKRVATTLLWVAVLTLTIPFTLECEPISQSDRANGWNCIGKCATKSPQ